MTHVVTGLQKLAASDGSILGGLRCGLVTNPCGIDRHFQSSIDVLFRHPGIHLTALFGPEHGIRGEVQAGGKVQTSTDPGTGLPIHSLYGETRIPTSEMLADIDVMIVDLQDIGVRYATYLSTLDNVLTACHDHNKRTVILDRPNPLGGCVVSGGLLDIEFRSFIGTHTLPILHGMTLGELGLLIAYDRGLTMPDVVTMDDWSRSMLWDNTGLPWVFPSPNLPTLNSHLVYPATCLIEGTTLSEGRGTTRPFEMFGSPDIDPSKLTDLITDLGIPGVAVRPVYFVPIMSKHAGQRCGGVQIYIDRDHLDRTPELGVRIIHLLATHSGADFDWTALTNEGSHHFIDLLTGGDDLRLMIERGDAPSFLLNKWAEQAEAFRSRRASFLLYHS